MAEEGPDPRSLMRAIALRRDRGALAELYALFAPRLRGFLFRLGCDGAEADDLIHDIFLTVWQRADRYDPERASVSTWLFTVARNRRIDRLRRERRHEAAEAAPPPPSDGRPHPDDVIAADRIGERLRRLIKELPVEQSEVLRRAYFEEQTLLVISQETNVPLGTVKSRVRLAFQHLRRALEDPP